MSGLVFGTVTGVLALLLGLACTIARAAETDGRLGPQNSRGWGFVEAPTHDPALPNVLLIGDSILAGYRDTVISQLRGKANVDAFINPFHQASPELYDQLRLTVGHGKNYVVIHFNMGLHGWQKGRIPEGQFEPLTRKLVGFLRAAEPVAKLIWASSTPAREKERSTALDPEINSSVLLQNRLAAEVMKSESVAVNDLYGVMVQHLALAKTGDQFHWTPAGSALQGETVARSIVPWLTDTPAKAGRP